MKFFNFLLILTLLIASNHLSAQTDAAILEDSPEMTTGPIMTFESTIVDYGEIEQNSEPLRTAKFTNTGTEPLVIKSARGSCGCTVPTYPKQPIMPGESAVIEVRYDTKRVGKINKTVTITTNEGSDPHVLKVLGKISKVQEEESVPGAKNSLIKGS